jgi:hypothetical protein
VTGSRRATREEPVDQPTALAKANEDAARHLEARLGKLADLKEHWLGETEAAWKELTHATRN